LKDNSQKKYQNLLNDKMTEKPPFGGSKFIFSYIIITIKMYNLTYTPPRIIGYIH